MPKFNVKKLQGLGEELAKTDNVQTGTYKVGAGLLSEVSKDKNIEDDIIYLKKSQIVRNENNHYSINNIDSFDKFINAIAKDGKIDIEGIVDEEIEIIKSIPNFDFSIPVLGNGNISNGNITISIPFINKGIMFNQSDLETFRQLLTK